MATAALRAPAPGCSWAFLGVLRSIPTTPEYWYLFSGFIFLRADSLFFCFALRFAMVTFSLRKCPPLHLTGYFAFSALGMHPLKAPPVFSSELHKAAFAVFLDVFLGLYKYFETTVNFTAQEGVFGRFLCIRFRRCSGRRKGFVSTELNEIDKKCANSPKRFRISEKVRSCQKTRSILLLSNFLERAGVGGSISDILTNFQKEKCMKTQNTWTARKTEVGGSPRKTSWKMKVI